MELIILLILMSLFLAIALAILKGKLYGLISGFNQKSEEEQERLIRLGFPKALGRLFLYLGFIFMLGIVLVILGLPHIFEWTMLLMVMILLFGLIRLQKYEQPEKRSKHYLLTIIFTVLFIVSITVMLVISTGKSELHVTKNSMEITGVYGDTWLVDQITKVEVIETLPEIKRKTNGFDFLDYRKGHFELAEYGKGMLFIKNKVGPFLMIHLKDGYIIMNDDKAQVDKWYNKLQEVLY